MNLLHLPPDFGIAVTTRRRRHFLAALAVLLLAGGFCGSRLIAAESAKSEAKPPPRLTERDYLVEELKLAEEQLQKEQSLADAGKSSPDRLLGAKRGVLSLRRQLAAYDERTKRPTPEQEAERTRRIEEQKREKEQQEQRVEGLKQELLPVLLEIAQRDNDARVRQTAVGSINRLRMESSIEPLGQMVLKDTDTGVRSYALSTLADFRNEQSLDTLLKIYDQLPDSESGLKQNVLERLQVQQKRYNPDGVTWNMVTAVPTNVVPKLTQIAQSSPVRELRRTALQQLSSVSGEETTAALIGLYEHCDDNEFKQTIVRYLGGRGDAPAMRQLVTIAKSDNDPRARQLAVELLGGMPFGGGQGRGPVGVPMMPPMRLPSR